MKVGGILRSLLGAAPEEPSAAPQVTSDLPGHRLAELLLLRRKVWQAWFGGDTATLRRHLGPELVAIGPDSRPWERLGESLEASARFVADGSELLGVEFPVTVTHRFGPVVVLFSEYRLMHARNGALRALQGRSTEVFVESGGRWVHTSWHLDAVS